MGATVVDCDFSCVRPGIRILKGEPPDLGSESLDFVLKRPESVPLRPSEPLAVLLIVGEVGFFVLVVWLARS